MPHHRLTTTPRRLLSLAAAGCLLAALSGAAAALPAPSPSMTAPASRAASGTATGSTAPTQDTGGRIGRPSLPLLRASGAGPNVMVVMADDMRVDDLRFAPEISALIGDTGVRFENSFSPYPLCCPARASFLTGQYAHNHLVYWHKAPYGYGAFDDSRTLATSFREAGYNTGFVGKYLNGYGQMPSKVTGDPSYRYVPEGWTDWAASLMRPVAAQPGHRSVVGSTYDYFRTSYNLNGRVDTSHVGRYQTGVVGALSRAMIGRYHRADAPFLLYSSYLAPHHGGPFEPDDPAGVQDREGGLVDDFATPARPDWVKGRFDSEVVRPSGMPLDGSSSEEDVSDKPSFFSALSEPSDAEVAAMTLVTRQRAESIAVMDAQVGRTVAKLQRIGEWEDTVVVFTSDNGYFLGEHRQRTGKVRAHEPSLRVPVLVTGPGVPAGELRYDPISTVDLTATLLDVADARPPAPADGTSRWPSITGGDRGWTAPVVTEATASLGPAIPERPTNPDGDPATAAEPGGPTATLPLPPGPGPAARERAAGRFAEGDARTSVGLRTAQYSFSLYRNGDGELYDLDVDPLQLENVYRDPGYAEVRQILVEQWQGYASCQARTCRTPLPASLQRGPAQNATATSRYWAALTAEYGPQR